MRADRHRLDWPNQPLPFKIYTTMSPRPLPLEFQRSTAGALDLNMLSRLCYFSNGVTRVLRGMPFRAAACTGAMYHIELYVVCTDVGDLEAGVYHYGAHDNGLRQLRAGDFRAVLGSGASVYFVLTSTWWRNAWKYQARAYRHAFWDGGTVLANLVSVASAQHVDARVLMGFVDRDVNRLLDIDPSSEGAIAVVALGSEAPPPATPPDLTPLNLPTRRLSPHQVNYPEIVQAHLESSLPSSDAVDAWRERYTATNALPDGEPIEDVILRRGSTRRFSPAPVSAAALHIALARATSPNSADAFIPSDVYLIVNAVEDVASGTYVYDRAAHQLQLLRAGEFRREAAYLDLGQELAGDAAVNVYWLVRLADIDDRGYRAAQLSAAIEAGKLYLAAYAQGLGATGLTFFDDDVTAFFSPHAAGKSVMFLTAVGSPRRPVPVSPARGRVGPL